MDLWTDDIDQYDEDMGYADTGFPDKRTAYTYHRQAVDTTSNPDEYYDDYNPTSSPSPSGWPNRDHRRFTVQQPFDNVDTTVEDPVEDILSNRDGIFVGEYPDSHSNAPHPTQFPRANIFQHPHSGLSSASAPRTNPFFRAVETQTMARHNVPRAPIDVLASEDPHDEDDQANRRGSNPRNVHGVQLRPVTCLPDIYRGVFKFPVFNAIQSKCFDTIMKSDENFVISAPTGSGKTVLFELSIIHMVMNAGSGSKCVYMAPTKALCSERFRDWVSKFESLGIKCCELTGDTVHFGRGAWGDARHATIIITTGEKWDSLTRSWRDNGHILSQIQLFLVDEVHILNESRGSTLEVIVSRMKSRGSAVRFVTVSATVPNINDIASWVGNKAGSGPAKVFEFGEDYRPCKLTRFVYGFPRSKNQNDFTFASNLSYRLFPLLQQHSANKPILVFASTRNGVLSTAERLMADYIKAAEAKQTLPWTPPRRIEHTFTDKRLEKLAQAGIGAHHAGLNVADKRIVEDLFLNKVLRVVVATSTLAVGVNLPAHIVVIKGVKVFQGGVGAQEYSDLDIMQMMGRAGRPQFDKEGIAIIMCESELEQKYKALTYGKTILESSLHTNLSEHLNSELGLGTISNLETAKQWIHGSFFYQRLRQNPRHYAAADGDKTWEDLLDGMLSRSVEGLKEAQLIRESTEDGGLSTTEYGDIMSRFYIRQSTMALIMKLPDRVTIRDLLEAVAAAEEISDLKLRGGEKQVYNKLRDHSDIRFKIKKVEKTTDKLFLLIQASLGGIPLHSPEYKTADSQPHAEVGALYRHLPRIARAIVEVAMVKENGSQIKHALELLRMFNAKTWEDRPAVLGQLSSVGEKSIKVLAEHGITTFDSLRKIDQFQLEQILSRKTGTGATIITALAELPKYLLEVKEISVTSSNGKGPVDIELAVKCGLECVKSSSRSKKKERGWDYSFILTLTSDHDLVDFRRIPTNALRDGKEFTVEAQLTKPSQSIIVYISSEVVAGVTVFVTYKPKLNRMEYPTLDTRPKSSIEMDLEGLEEDPNFWDWSMSQDDSEEIPIKDLTKSGSGQARHSTMRPTKARVSESSKQVPAPPAPQKLPNGKYMCNHTCKDKTACRHLCCREGLDKPPATNKRRDGPMRAETPKRTAMEAKPQQKKPVEPPKKANSTSTPSKPQTSKSVNRYMDSQMRQLDSLHARTGVSSNLQMARGQRIKMPDNLQQVGRPSDARKRPPKRPPKFDLELTNLEDDKPVELDVDFGGPSDED
ncbi:Sec63 Brl domain-containing protein, partial [Amylostereum chailletii]